ncbi:MAG: hypothetical protein COA79_09745 [Planctomycetota bacterium]|nr:MAG: hypothetical protein COA79_09745 [Planctomycetota bacterium]
MKNYLQGLAHQQFGFPFSEKAIPLYGLITATGYMLETSSNYLWDGQKRGKSDVVIFQYTFSGQGKLEYEGKKYNLTPGQAMLVKVPHDHIYYLEERQQWEFHYIVMNGREILRIWNYILDTVGPVIELNPEGAVIKLCKEIFFKAKEGEIDNPYKSSSYAFQLVMVMLEEVYCDNNQKVSSHSPVLQSIEFCEKNYMDNIGVEEMALSANLSKYHFSRIFKLQRGVSPAHYLSQFRLKIAIGLLRETEKSVKEIAFESGFNDANYFSKIFKKSLGVSPNEFRKGGIYSY